MKTLSLLVSFTALTAFSQSEPVVSMFWNTSEYYNPATTGMDYKHKAIVHHRHEGKFDDGMYSYPFATNTTASYGARSEKLHGGIGINGLYEARNSFRSAKLNANYSYHLKIGKSVLGLGVQAGYVNSSVGGFTPDGLQTFTIFIPEEKKSSSYFNSAAGVYFKRKKLSLGFSTTQLAQSGKNNFGQMTRYFLMGSYDIDVTKNFQLTPSFLFSTRNWNHDMDANLRATIYQKIWLGVSARNRDAFSFMAGYDFAGKFRIGYAYEHSVSRLKYGANPGIHEFVLGLLLK